MRVVDPVIARRLLLGTAVFNGSLNTRRLELQLEKKANVVQCENPLVRFVVLPLK